MTGKRDLRLYVVIGTITGVLVACGGAVRRELPSRVDAVRIGMFSTRSTATLNVAGLFSSEPLVAAAFDGRPIFKLAESVVELADRRQLKVMLRKDVRFHNGQPLTAANVRALLTKKIGQRAPEIAEISVAGDYELLFRLHRPSTLKAEDLSTIMVDDDGDEGDPALRTGPFKLTSTTPTVLEAFDQYYQGPPNVRRLEVRQYPTHRAAWSGMMRGEVNVLHEVSRDIVEFVEASGDIRAYPLLRPYYTALIFNQRHPVLGRREVRIAINEAIDREELVRNGMRGNGRIAEGPFWPYHWAYPAGRFPVTFNPDAAKLRLDGAGLQVNAAAERRMPSRFSFTCLTLADDDRFERIALLLQRQLYAVGIDMRIVALPLTKLPARIESGDFDAFLLEYVSGRILKFAYQAWHSPTAPGRYMRTGYVAADAPLDRLQAARSDDEVRRALADVMHVMRSDPPAAFLVWPREVRAGEATFDIPYEPDRDIFGTLWQVKPAQVQAVRR